MFDTETQSGVANRERKKRVLLLGASACWLIAGVGWLLLGMTLAGAAGLVAGALFGVRGLTGWKKRG